MTVIDNQAKNNDVFVVDTSKLTSQCLNGVYKEFAEHFGVDTALKIHNHFSGLTVSFPKKFISDTHLQSLIYAEYDGKNSKRLARKYGYTHAWLKKLLDGYCEKPKQEQKQD